MDSKETASSPITVPSTGSSLSPSSYDSAISAAVPQTNGFDDNNTKTNGEKVDSSTASSKSGTFEEGGLESGLEQLKKENNGDPFLFSVNNNEKESKGGVLVGGEIVEGGSNGPGDRTEVEKTIDNVGKVDEVGLVEAAEVVDVGKDGSADGTEVEKGMVDDNSADPLASSVGNSIVENESRNDDEEKVNKDEGGNNGSVERIEVEKSIVNVGKVDEVGEMEASEVVEGGKAGPVDRTELDKGIGEENSGDPHAGSLGNTIVENELKNDDEEKVNKGGVLVGEDIGEGGVNGPAGRTEVNSVDLKVTGIEEGASGPVVEIDAENSGNTDAEKMDGEVLKCSQGDDVKNANSDNAGLEEMELKGEEPVEASKGEPVTNTEYNIEVNEKIENPESNDVGKVNAEGVEADDLKFTSEGDSVVEGIDVKLSESGAVLVGEVKGTENMQSAEVEGSVKETVALGNGNDITSQLTEKVVGLIEEDIRISESAADETVDRSESKLVEPNINVGIAAAQNIEEEPVLAEVMVDESQKNNAIEKPAESQTQENVTNERIGVDGEVESVDQVSRADNIEDQDVKVAIETSHSDATLNDGEVENKISDKSIQLESAEAGVSQQEILGGEDDSKNPMDEQRAIDGSISDEDTEEAKQFIEELERRSGAESSHDNSQRIDGQIVTDSDEEGETDEEGDGKELFDSDALAALLRAATGADTDGGSITIRSQDGSRLFSVERPAGLGSSLRSLRPAPQPNRPLFPPTTFSSNATSDNNLSDEEKKKLQKLQDIRVKYLRLLKRLGVSSEESIVNQVLYRLQVVAGRQSNQLFNMDAAKQMAMQLEAEGKDDLDFSVNILVLGKCGVGKSATINSILGQEKATINAFEPATSTVKEICGFVDGVKVRVFDTPGLKPSVMEQAFNRSVLSSVKKLTKRTSPDILLYVDRLDAPTRDLNDLPTLRTVTSSLGTSIWRSAIVTLTHAASAPPDGPSGSPLSYEAFITQRSHVVQQSIGQAVGDLRMMSPSLMNPVSLVENHPSCRKNREGQKILPNGQSWRPQLLLLCYSMKILSEASALSKPQDPFDHRKLFGFRARSPPLPYMLSSMLQSRPHPKLSSDQGGDNGDSDIDLDDYSDTDQEEEDEYDQLPPFKPLKKAQLARLSREQRNAYFEEYDYRVKLLQKKQWREELRRMREMKTTGKGAAVDYGDTEEDAAAPIAVPLPDMALPPSFDSDYPAYRYRFLEPTSQFLARPVLDTHGWDHDCGYDGVNLEHALAIASRFPASYTIQISKDKKDFTINLDSSISAKHGENGSTMAGFDIQSIGKQLAYIVRGETKFKNLKKNKTAGGISVTFLGENVVPGIKLEDQVTLGKQYALTGSAGAVRSQHDTAYGANFELQRREQDYPIGQVQSTFSMSIIKWRGDLALGFNCLSQFSIGRNSKVAVRAGINNKLSGQISVKTSSSDHLSLALTAIIPTAIAIYRKLQPDVGEKYSIY